MVQYEPWLERDRAMIDPLKTVGIEKGKAFNPDSQAQDALSAGARDAHAWLDHNYEKVFIPPFNEGTQWALPASQELVKAIESNYTNSDSYPTDARGLTYSYGFFSAKHLGAGQYYLMTIKDKQGQRLNGASTYKLTVPANAPVNQYWSATIYSSTTHAFIRNIPCVSRSSQNVDLKKNADGSVDIYFAPKPSGGSGQLDSNRCQREL